VHGLLHARGMDHDRAASARRMEALELDILAGLGLPDPYRWPAAAGRALR
jgi:probable rRNA maturation factor